MDNNNNQRLIDLLSQYFSIGDSYAYNLTRVKEAFSVGTVTLDDFEEFSDNTVADIANFLTSKNTLVLPAEVGSVVYGIHEVWIDEGDDDAEEDVYGNKVLRGKVCDFYLDINNRLWASVEYESGFVHRHKSTDFGVSVFSSFEEAETALKTNFSEE